jgi:glucose-1-phosphate adenylyltransferase
LFSAVRAEHGSLIEDSVILPKVQIGAGARIRRAVIDKRCRIPEGMDIGYDPVHDAKHFHVTAGGITLVTPEMLGQRTHTHR